MINFPLRHNWAILTFQHNWILVKSEHFFETEKDPLLLQRSGPNDR